MSLDIPESDVRRAVKMSGTYVRYYAAKTRLPAEQLEDYAATGLLQAWVKFDAAKGVPFDLFCRVQLRFAFLEALRVSNASQIWHVQRLRQRHRHRRHIPPQPAAAEELVAYAELVRHCDALLHERASPRQQALFAGLVEGYSCAELAQAWGISKAAVAQHLAVIRRLLRPVMVALSNA